MRLLRWLACHMGWHLRCVRRDDGFHCIDCGYFKSKAEYLADLHAGGI